MTRLYLRASAVAVAAILALAGCTASSDASPAPEDVATTPSDVAAEEESFGSELDQIAITDSRPEEIQVALVDEVVASNRRLIEVIDTSTGARHTLVAVKPLRIGEEAASGERFGNIDVGGDRVVVFETTVGEEPTHINIVTPAGERSDLGEGGHPAIRPDGQAFAFFGPSGVTVMWSPGSVLDDGLAVAGSVAAIRFSPDGSKLAIAWENEGRGGVTVVEVQSNGFGETWDVPQPSGRRYSLPAWVDNNHIGVLDLAVGRDGTGTLLTVDVVSGDVISSVKLDDEIVDVDYSAGGATALLVTLDGQIKWLVAGASGLILGGYHQAARW